MKTKTWILLLGAVLILCAGASFFLLMPGDAATHAEILSDGALMHTVDLRIDREITITTYNGGHNVIMVKDGKIAVTEATCPDHYCMQRGYCDRGTQIVCLPNRLVIRFVGAQEIDAVAG